MSMKQKKIKGVSGYLRSINDETSNEHIPNDVLSECLRFINVDSRTDVLEERLQCIKDSDDIQLMLDNKLAKKLSVTKNPTSVSGLLSIPLIPNKLISWTLKIPPLNPPHEISTMGISLPFTCPLMRFSIQSGDQIVIDINTRKRTITLIRNHFAPSFDKFTFDYQHEDIKKQINIYNAIKLHIHLYNALDRVRLIQCEMKNV